MLFPLTTESAALNRGGAAGNGKEGGFSRGFDEWYKSFQGRSGVNRGAEASRIRCIRKTGNDVSPGKMSGHAGSSSCRSSRSRADPEARGLISNAWRLIKIK